MNALRTRLGVDADHEKGLSIIEVVVAMFIFAIISTGAIYSMLSVLQITRDSRSQQVAANLAAQDIDLARDYDDLFALIPTTYTVVLNNDVFTVKRETEWVSAAGNDVKCGSGGAALSYKRVNITVTWANMRNAASAVHSDTVLDPNSRITDPTKGTLLIFVKKDSGEGSGGVTVTATPSSTPNGAVTPSPNTAVTDASGCAYILKVQPGNYDVTVSHSPATFVDIKQAVTSTLIQGVQANATASNAFQYDDAAKAVVSYAPGQSTTPLLPTDLLTTFWNTYGTYSALRPSTANTFPLHPYLGGYQVVAGKRDTCAAVDSDQWGANTSGVFADDVPFISTVAGTSVSVPVPMGVFKLKTTGSNSNRYLRAVSVNAPGSGNPGCAVDATYRFGQILPSSSSGSDVTVALPFGTYKLYADGSNTSTSAGNLITAVSVVKPTTITTGFVLAGVVTLDPRPAP